MRKSILWLAISSAIGVAEVRAGEPPPPKPQARLPTANDIHNESGSSRSTDLRHATGGTNVQVGEHREAAPRDFGGERATGGLDESLANELAQKQMRRNQKPIDECMKTAHKRNKSLAGSVVMAVSVADKKVAKAALVGDTMEDKQLDQCLLDSTKKWQFAVPSASFRWQVDVEALPVAARKTR